MKNPFRKADAPAVPALVVYFPISPQILKADIDRLRDLTEEDATLGAALRLLVDLHGSCIAAAEAAVRTCDDAHTPAVALARASGVAAAIDTLVAATRGRLGRHGHQETGFGAEEQ